MNSDVGKLYMKIEAFDEIYNFVGQSFSIWSHLHSQIIDTLSIDYLTMKVTSNGKTLNYKSVDLVESYNFHIKFTSIRVQTKKLQNFENCWDPYRRGTLRVPTAVGHGGRSLPPSPWC
jgi:hypothetical protein